MTALTLKRHHHSIAKFRMTDALTEIQAGAVPRHGRLPARQRLRQTLAQPDLRQHVGGQFGKEA